MTGKARVRAQRQRRDPAVKAGEALGVAERRVDKLRARHGELGRLADSVAADLEFAVRERDFLALSPYLSVPAVSE